jgi:hypothetical protein
MTASGDGLEEGELLYKAGDNFWRLGKKGKGSSTRANWLQARSYPIGFGGRAGSTGGRGEDTGKSPAGQYSSSLFKVMYE